MNLLRQIIGILIVCAYVGTAVMQVAPAVAATGSNMSAMHMTPDADGKMPPCSKGMGSKCMTEMGCIFLLSVPAPNVQIATTLVWSVLEYGPGRQLPMNGRLVAPALRPPNFLA